MCHFGNNFSEIKISLPKAKWGDSSPVKKNNNNNRIYFFRKDSYSKASNRHRWNERHILLTQPQPKQFPQQLGGPAYLHSAPVLSARQQLAERPPSGVWATDAIPAKGKHSALKQEERGEIYSLPKVTQSYWNSPRLLSSTKTGYEVRWH